MPVPTSHQPQHKLQNPHLTTFKPPINKYRELKLYFTAHHYPHPPAPTPFSYPLPYFSLKNALFMSNAFIQ